MKLQSKIYFKIKILGLCSVILFFLSSCYSQTNSRNMSIAKMTQKLNKNKIKLKNTFFKTLGFKKENEITYLNEKQIMYFDKAKSSYTILELDTLFNGKHKKLRPKYSKNKLNNIKKKFSSILYNEHLVSQKKITEPSNKLDNSIFVNQLIKTLSENKPTDAQIELRNTQFHNLRMAIQNCNIDRVEELLLKDKVNPNIVKSGSNTPLYYTIDTLINSSINYREENIGNYITIISTLLKYGANPNIIYTLAQNCSTHLAILYNEVDILEILLQNPQTNINQANGFGETLLYTAIDCENYPSMDLLIKYGVNPNIGEYNTSKNTEDNTPLHLAIYKKKIKAIKKICDAGGDPLKPNIEGVTPLDFALQSMKGNKKVISLLLNTKDQTGHLPIHNSILMETKYLKKLIKLGVDIDALSNDGSKAIELASKNFYLDKIKILLDAKVELVERNKINKKTDNIIQENITNCKEITLYKDIIPENKIDLSKMNQYSKYRMNLLQNRINFAEIEIQKRRIFFEDSIEKSDVYDYKWVGDKKKSLDESEIFYEKVYRKSAWFDAMVYKLHNLNEFNGLSDIKRNELFIENKKNTTFFIKMMDFFEEIYDERNSYKEFINNIGAKKTLNIYNSMSNFYSSFGIFLESQVTNINKSLGLSILNYYTKSINILNYKSDLSKEYGISNYFYEYLEIAKMSLNKSEIYDLIQDKKMKEVEAGVVLDYLFKYKKAYERFKSNTNSVPDIKNLEYIILKLKAKEILGPKKEIFPILLSYYRKSKEAYILNKLDLNYYIEARANFKNKSFELLKEHVSTIFIQCSKSGIIKLNNEFRAFFETVFNIYYSESDFESCYKMLKMTESLPKVGFRVKYS